MINALIVHSSSMISNRENGSLAESLFWFNDICEIHTGAAFLKSFMIRKRRVVYVIHRMRVRTFRGTKTRVVPRIKIIRPS